MIEYLVRKKKNSESERVEDGYERGLKRLLKRERELGIWCGLERGERNRRNSIV